MLYDFRSSLRLCEGDRTSPMTKCRYWNDDVCDDVTVNPLLVTTSRGLDVITTTTRDRPHKAPNKLLSIHVSHFADTLTSWLAVA